MRRRIAFGFLLAAAIALYFTLAPRWPKDQTLHVVLGDAAPRVSEVRLRYAEPAAALAEDWTREVTFRYAIEERPGDKAKEASTSAPRVITHVARLADGDYLVEIDVTSSANRTTTTRRRVTLLGGATSIDVAHDVAEGTAP